MPVPLTVRDEGQFLTAAGQLLQSGDLTQQAVVEQEIGAPLLFSRMQSTLFGHERLFRPAPGSAAAARGVVWESITLETPPARPTRVASLEISNLPAQLCVDEAAVRRRFRNFTVDDTARAVTVYSGPGQEGEFYVRFTKGTGERCFIAVTFVQNSNR